MEDGCLRWYFVCDCLAKFFSIERTAICPRCGEALVSQEQLPVPWLVDAARQASLREGAKLLPREE